MILDDRPIVVVMDTNVIVHQIYDEGLLTLGDVGSDISLRPHLNNYVATQMAWVRSGMWLPSEVLAKQVSMVWAMDCLAKRYWRTEFLASDAITQELPVKKSGKNKGKSVPIVYKGGRRQATRMFELVRAQVLNILHTTEQPVLYRDCYEADDLIATLTVVNDMLSQAYNIIVATVDNDLLGLVREGVGWVCTAGWEPRVRLDIDGVNKWRRGKGLPEVQSGAEIWEQKAYVEGDKSDNIPPCPSGATLTAIDLLSPPEEHRLWEVPEVRDECMGALMGNYLINRDLGALAHEALRIRGCQPVIKPLVI